MNHVIQPVAGPDSSGEPGDTEAGDVPAVRWLGGLVAHVVNNHLTTIMGNAELVLEDLSDQGSREKLKEILAAVEHLAEFTRSLRVLADGTASSPISLAPEGLARLCGRERAAGLARRTLPGSTRSASQMAPDRLRA